MSDPRFKPPGSKVLAATRAGGPARQMLPKLALLTLIQFALMCTGALGPLFGMTSRGSLNAMGFAALMAGLACLYVGIARLVLTRVRATRFLDASAVLQILSAGLWHAFYLRPWQLEPAANILLPVVLGVVVAAAGRFAPNAWLADPGEPT